MRGVSLTLAVFLACGLLPVAGAQGGGPAGPPAPAGPVTVLEEPAGDLRLTVAGNVQPVPESRFQALDLVGLAVAEGEDGFTFTVRLAGLDQPPEAPGIDDGIVMVNAVHNGQEYQIVIVRALGDQSYYFAYLLKYDAEGQENFQRMLDVTADAAAGTLATTLGRDELLDAQGAAPFPGRALEGFWASTVLRSSRGFANVNGIDPGTMYNVEDRMPDAGRGAGAFAVRLGLAQGGHAALWSRDPIRASNGEQATYVFNVTAQNSGPREELFRVAAAGAPPDWQVAIPDAYLRIGAGQSVAIPVLVSTPFTHTHGALKKVRLEMQSQDDPASVGRLDVGVRYFAIPQPGGHHSRLLLHSTQFGSQSPLFKVFDLGFSGNSGFPYMNTLDDDPADVQVPLTGNFWGYYCSEGCPPEVPHVEWRWFVWLQPSIEMGLDFDLATRGTLSVPIQAQVPITGAAFGGHLVHLYYDDVQGDWVETRIADFAAPAQDLMPNQPVVFTFPVQARPEADLLPHAKRAYLGLLLNLTSHKPGLFTGVEAPLLLPGGAMDLPLFEYRDPLMPSFSTVGAIRLEALGGHERLVNPGKTALFSARLTNDLDEDLAFGVAVGGTHADWARVVGPSEMFVPARSAVEVRVAVAVPPSATDRDAADLIVTAQATGNPELHGIARLVAVVDLGHEHPDEAAALAALEQPQAKEGPAPVAGLLAGLAAALGVSRRRARMR